MGTRGDVEPCLRLGAALCARGHSPLVLSHGAYEREVVDTWGLDFRSCGIDTVPLSPDYLEGKTRADQVYADRGWYGDAWVDVGMCMRAAADEHECDVIIATSMGNTHALDIAEKEQLLCFCLKFCPDIDGQVPTGTFPPSGYPDGMPGPLNYAAHVLENTRTVGSVFAGGFIPRVIEFRKVLGFESMKIDGQGLLPFRVMDDIEVPTYSPYRNKLQANQPSFYAFSETLADRPPEYASWHFMTGSFGRRDVEKPPQLEPALASFLDSAAQAGDDVVCVAFGSMSLARSSPWQSRAVSAARKLGAAVVVVDPQGVEGPASGDAKVHVVRSSPYSALFPRCSLVVHHGGAGTMQDCLWAGTAQIAAPVLSWSDQPFWADCLQSRGLGLRLGGGSNAPEEAEWEEALSSALGQLEHFRSQAREVAAASGDERGPEAACDILEAALLEGR